MSVLPIVGRLVEALDKNQFIEGVLIDLLKAFDDTLPRYFVT